MNLANSGHETGNISAVALSFMVHEPSGIIEDVSEDRAIRAADVAQHLGFGVVRLKTG